MRSFLRTAAVLSVLLGFTLSVPAEQDKVIRSSVGKPGETISAMLTVNAAGERMLRVSIPSGRNVGGATPERILVKDLTVRALAANGTELRLLPITEYEVIPGVCNAGSCTAIAHFHFSMPADQVLQLRNVTVTLKGNKHELVMQPFVASGERR